MHTNLKKQFTLVEILTVIAIIAILAGILFPVLSKVMDKARSSTTKDTMVSIVQAVDSFYSTYEYMIDYGSNEGEKSTPVDDKAVSKYGDFASEGGVEPGDKYYNFFDILCYTYHGATSKNVKARAPATDYNKQAVRFLATPKKYYTNNSNKFEDSVRDAWDQPFVIFLNTEGSGVITVSGDKYANGTYTANCFLFSVGVPTGKDDVDAQVKAGYIKSMD